MEEVVLHLRHAIKELQHKIAKESNTQERIRLFGKMEGVKESLHEIRAYQESLGL